MDANEAAPRSRSGPSRAELEVRVAADKEEMSLQHQQVASVQTELLKHRAAKRDFDLLISVLDDASYPCRLMAADAAVEVQTLFGLKQKSSGPYYHRGVEVKALARRAVARHVFSFLAPPPRVGSAVLAQGIVDAVVMTMEWMRLLCDKVLHVRARTDDNAASLRLAQYAISSAIKVQHEHHIIEHIIQTLLAENVITAARRGDGEHRHDLDRNVMTSIVAVWRDADAEAKRVVAAAKARCPGNSTTTTPIIKKAIVDQIKSLPPEPTSLVLSQRWIGMGVAARPPALLRSRQCDLVSQRAEKLRAVGRLKVNELKTELGSFNVNLKGLPDKKKETLRTALIAAISEADDASRTVPSSAVMTRARAAIGQSVFLAAAASTRARRSATTLAALRSAETAAAATTCGLS